MTPNRPCPRCGGTGKNPETSTLGWPGDPCYICHGTGTVEPRTAPDSGDDLTKILKSLAEATHADGWGGINSYSLDMVAEARAAIEALYAARFERALGGKEKYDGVEPTYDRMIGARNRLRAEARTRWYTPEPKGEQHG